MSTLDTLVHATMWNSNATRNKNEWFYLFSPMTSDYVKKYENFCGAKKNYSLIHGYFYENDFNKLKSQNVTSFHPTDLKILAIEYLLSGNASNHKTSSIGDDNTWFVFLDADAIIGENEVPLTLLTQTAMNFTKRVRRNVDEYQECHFIAQDDGVGVNSGFWMIRNSSWSKHFVAAWKDCYYNIEVSNWHLSPDKKSIIWPHSGWNHDQGSLMNTILHVSNISIVISVDVLLIIFNYTAVIMNEKYSAKERGKEYNDTCYESPSAGKANKCFQSTLSRDFNYSFGGRSIGKICLLPTTGIPSTHHQQYHYRRGNLVQHGKQLTPTQLAFKGILGYDHINGELIYPNNTLIKKYGSDKSVYVILDDGKMHKFPNFDTFAKMRYGVEDILILDSREFQRIGSGDMLPYMR